MLKPLEDEVWREARLMRKLVVIGIVLLGILPIHAQHLSLVAVSHNIGEYDYNYTTPGTSSCNIYSTSVYCTDSPAQMHTGAVYRFTEVVVANGMRYTLTRTARWVWNSMTHLNDGETFAAEIKGKHMYITSYRGGNQGKRERIKYDILDIRPS